MQNTLLASIHQALTTPGRGLQTPDATPTVVARAFYGLNPRKGSKALFRSKELEAPLAGRDRAVTISLMTAESGEEFLQASCHVLGSKDPQWIPIGFLSINTSEAYEASGVFAGGRLMADSPLVQWGTHAQLAFDQDGLMVLQVF